MNIAVYGATGFTGRLICRRLATAGARLVLSGRDRVRLEELAAELDADCDVRPAAVHDRDALRDALRGADVVVSCAGPFTIVGEPVVRAAIDVGVHYLDTTGEQHFMRDVYERYESAARRSGVTIVNGFAFEIAIGDFCAALAAAAIEGRPLDEVAIGYAINRFRPTRASQLSMLESLRGPASVWIGDRWDHDTPGSERRTIGFPYFSERKCASFPSGEVITVPRHVDTRRVQAYLGLSGDSTLEKLLGRATRFVGPAVSFLSRTPLAAHARSLLSTTPPAPSDDDRDDTTFSIVAEARCGFEQHHVGAFGRDIYGVTAEIVAWGAAELARRDDCPAGVLAPSEAFDPDAGLAAIAERGRLELTRSFHEQE